MQHCLAIHPSRAMLEILRETQIYNTSLAAPSVAALKRKPYNQVNNNEQNTEESIPRREDVRKASLLHHIPSEQGASVPKNLQTLTERQAHRSSRPSTLNPQPSKLYPRREPLSVSQPAAQLPQAQAPNGNEKCQKGQKGQRKGSQNASPAKRDRHTRARPGLDLILCAVISGCCLEACALCSVSRSISCMCSAIRHVASNVALALEQTNQPRPLLLPPPPLLWDNYAATKRPAPAPPGPQILPPATTWTARPTTAGLPSVPHPHPPSASAGSLQRGIPTLSPRRVYCRTRHRSSSPSGIKPPFSRDNYPKSNDHVNADKEPTFRTIALCSPIKLGPSNARHLCPSLPARPGAHHPSITSRH
ncbi:hypothetical protein CFIO01_04781 [Colletotrichum fioriniae PJ7]|uniref:Uncharacterized protein n=1 Tax=Colletotrichum fioriniae PJ7 TaxID=1445577 RepID=A0A010SIF7_9PEZI|nr:hypothetical protein CFIO01_04781 [Colletotrichum fioriniae PJ7]